MVWVERLGDEKPPNWPHTPPPKKPTQKKKKHKQLPPTHHTHLKKAPTTGGRRLLGVLRRERIWFIATSSFHLGKETQDEKLKMVGYWCRVYQADRATATPGHPASQLMPNQN